MNLREKGLLTELYWYIAENKSEHPVLYHGKDILQSILRGEFGVADRLLKHEIIRTKNVSDEPNRYDKVSDDS